MIHPTLLNHSVTPVFPVLPPFAEPSSPPLFVQLLLSHFVLSTSFYLRPNIPCQADSSKAALSLSRINPCSSFSSFFLPLPFFTIVPVFHRLLALSPFPPGHPLRTHLHLFCFCFQFPKKRPESERVTWSRHSGPHSCM